MEVGNVGQVLEQIVADVEEMLSKASDAGLRNTMLRLAEMTPKELCRKSETDQNLILHFALIGVTYLNNRRAEAKSMGAT